MKRGQSIEEIGQEAAIDGRDERRGISSGGAPFGDVKIGGTSREGGSVRGPEDFRTVETVAGLGGDDDDDDDSEDD